VKSKAGERIGLSQAILTRVDRGGSLKASEKWRTLKKIRKRMEAQEIVSTIRTPEAKHDVAP